MPASSLLAIFRSASIVSEFRRRLRPLRRPHRNSLRAPHRVRRQTQHRCSQHRRSTSARKTRFSILTAPAPPTISTSKPSPIVPHRCPAAPCRTSSTPSPAGSTKATPCFIPGGFGISKLKSWSTEFPHDNRSPASGPEIEADDVDSLTIYTAGIPAEYGRKIWAASSNSTLSATSQRRQSRTASSSLGWQLRSAALRPPANTVGKKHYGLSASGNMTAPLPQPCCPGKLHQPRTTVTSL